MLPATCGKPARYSIYLLTCDQHDSKFEIHSADAHHLYADAHGFGSKGGGLCFALHDALCTRHFAGMYHTQPRHDGVDSGSALGRGKRTG